jgi:hypothetical protein
MKRKKTLTKKQHLRGQEDKRCGLCGKTGKLTKTPCCGNWICDDEDQYQLFSYARSSCYRNHDHYTVCAVHCHEEHEGPDWRTCEECKEYFDKVENYVWSATNEHNFVKLENPPEYEPTRCSKCNSIIKLGDEPYSMKGGEYYCSKCFTMPRFSR